MIQSVISRIFNKENEEVQVITTEELVLEALCAYRDKLIMDDEMIALERTSKLAILAMAIDDTVNQIQAR